VTETVDVVLIGGGIMSATLGTLLSELQPDWKIVVYERLHDVGLESSNAWNNAGTGHAALCELNYTPAGPDGTVDPAKAIIQVENFLVATSQLAQTTLRSVLGKHELDGLLAEREKLNLDIQKVLDAQTDTWGIKVSNVEIKHVDLNESMVRAIARQAEAERERRAKVIHAEGEMQAAQQLLQAAQTLSQQPEAMQLRYLQTLSNIAGDKASTIVFPVPMDLLAPWLEGVKKDRP